MSTLEKKASPFPSSDEKVAPEVSGRQSVVAIEVGGVAQKGNEHETWYFDERANDQVQRRLQQRHVQMSVSHTCWAFEVDKADLHPIICSLNRIAVRRRHTVW